MKRVRYPFSKNSGLKFRKFHVPNGTVHSGYTDASQATARLAIVLVSRIQKRGTEDNNFAKWKGTLRFHLISNRKFRNFELNENCPVIRLQRRNLTGINLLTTIQYVFLTNKDLLHFNFQGHVKEKRLRIFLKKPASNLCNFCTLKPSFKFKNRQIGRLGRLRR